MEGPGTRSSRDEEARGVSAIVAGEDSGEARGSSSLSSTSSMVIEGDTLSVLFSLLSIESSGRLLGLLGRAPTVGEGGPL